MTKKYRLDELQNTVTFNDWLKAEYDLNVEQLTADEWAKYSKLWQIQVLDKV
jgi:deoxyadenosine/deoxycytidine kinase|tara:strand:+ start:428 stop:583 length:156 start_codon:yes stop_codon:yes gene_type:complete